MAIMDTNWQTLLSSDSDVQPDVFFLVATDEHLEAEGKYIGAHRTLLSCVSPVFKGMLLGPMKEKGEVIKVKETTHEAFNTMISFIYKVPGQDWQEYLGKVINCPQKLFELLTVADRYEILSLKTLTSDALGSLLISNENLIFTATVAKNYNLLFEDVTHKLLLRCLYWIKGGGVRDTATLISETKKNFPDASLDVLYELLNVDKETFRLPPLPGVFCLFIFVSNLYFVGWGNLVFFDSEEHQITDKQVLLASVPKLEAQWKIIHEFKPTGYPQLHQDPDTPFPKQDTLNSLEITYDGGFDDGGIPNLTMEFESESLNLYLRCPDFHDSVFSMDLSEKLALKLQGKFPQKIQLPKLQEWTRIEISHVEEGGQLFLSFTVGGQTKRRQASEVKGNLSHLTDVKIYIGDEYQYQQPGFVKGLMVLDQK